MELNFIPTAEEIFNEKCCYFCRENNNEFSKKWAGLVGNDYYCPHCGHYQITREAIYNLHIGAKFRALATSVAQDRKLRGIDDYMLQWYNIPEENDEYQICIGNVPFLKHYPVNYIEKIDRVLINIGRKTDNSPLNDFQADYHDFGLFFVEPPEEYYYGKTPNNDAIAFVIEMILKTVNILKENGWINKSIVYNGMLPKITLTVDGIRHLIELQNMSNSKKMELHELQNIEDNKPKAFVAMWFTDKEKYREALQKYYDSIKEAIERSGYSAFKVDDVMYNGSIMNKIIEQIKKSQFLIADLTCDKEDGMRGGVYYEAGLAAGLGKPVILTCNKEAHQKGLVHFDLKQFNTILWFIDDNGIIRSDLHHDREFAQYLADWIKETVSQKK